MGRGGRTITIGRQGPQKFFQVPKSLENFLLFAPLQPLTAKPVWCPRRKKLVAQHIKVISNVSLDIPYEDFQSLEQVVLAAEKNREYDDEHDSAVAVRK